MHCLPLGGCVGHNPQLCFSCLPQNFTIVLHEIHPNDSPCDVVGVYWKKMALIWRGKEHEEQYLTATNDLAKI